MLSRNYGLELRSDDPDNAVIFKSLRSFAAHIQSARTKGLASNAGLG